MGASHLGIFNTWVMPGEHVCLRLLHLLRFSNLTVDDEAAPEIGSQAHLLLLKAQGLMDRLADWLTGPRSAC